MNSCGCSKDRCLSIVDHQRYSSTAEGRMLLLATCRAAAAAAAGDSSAYAGRGRLFSAAFITVLMQFVARATVPIGLFPGCAARCAVITA